VEEEFGEGRGKEAKMLAWLYFCGRVGKQGDRVRDGGSTVLMRCRHIFLGSFGRRTGGVLRRMQRQDVVIIDFTSDAAFLIPWRPVHPSAVCH